jgi:hypothetical protein
MRIEDATQTVGGHPVRIYAADGGGNWPIHGAFWVKSFGWICATWTEEGSIEISKIPSSYDLDLHDWRDEIPWDCLRDDIQWVARNYNNEWIGFADKPTHYFLTGFWFGASVANLGGIKMPTGPADWREAIAKRPET